MMNVKYSIYDPVRDPYDEREPESYTVNEEEFINDIKQLEYDEANIRKIM